LSRKHRSLGPLLPIVGAEAFANGATEGRTWQWLAFEAQRRIASIMDNSDADEWHGGMSQLSAQALTRALPLDIFRISIF
jgi:hypothetical protein